MQPRYELFDHTADIGVRVWAPTMPELLRPATDGLYAVIGELHADTDPRVEQYDLAGLDAALLLRDYLAESLVLFERGRRLITALEVHEFSDHRLRATARSCALNEAQSEFSREVKAVTYHELAIRAVPDGYEATYIVDI